ncbi:MAG: AAA family ATPase [Desulfovibrionaceae bacterium]|nr:AAA family ATPase [Desulfovibrionaceae bacterium]
MQELPIGVHDFFMIRGDNLLYVDKTRRLLDLIERGRRYFLARPRRFGKSLTLTTLEAMFLGKASYFRGLEAEKWVSEHAQSPSPVLRIDMSLLSTPKDEREFHDAMNQILQFSADRPLAFEKDCSLTFANLIRKIYQESGSVVVLIDEYDSLILANIDDTSCANSMRLLLCPFYMTLKALDRYLRFVFITGISKFSKVGVFSAMNNLQDISLSEKYVDIVGYTQQELEMNFSEYIQSIAAKKSWTQFSLSDTIKMYYDGFSFDGKTRVYNPYSLLTFFSSGEIANYWYESGSPTFIVNWMRKNGIDAPDEYSGIEVGLDFTSSFEIENAKPYNLLYQSGYLTLRKKEGNLYTLDYPNKEVLDSLSALYLECVYRVSSFASLGADLWRALLSCDLTRLVALFSQALSSIPYEDFKNRDEYWYRSLFLMLLRGAGILVFFEVHCAKGRSDLILVTGKAYYVFEFKRSPNAAGVERAARLGTRQIRARDYAGIVVNRGLPCVMAVLVACDCDRTVSLHTVE